MFSRSKSTSQIKVVNFLILVTFQIKDLEGHYLKLVLLQVPHYLQAPCAQAPGASWSQPCIPVGHDDIRR